MPKRVPAVERAIRILKLLGEQPEAKLTLSELAARADINLSTCHGILTCLTEELMVIRQEPSRTYSLGPLMAELGAAAMSQHLGLPDAQEAITRLTEKFRLTGLIGGRVGDEILVLAHTTVDGRPPATPQGFRGPMIPPSGALFMAWAPPARVERWLHGLGDEVSAADRQHHMMVLQQVRNRGYLVSLNGTLGETAIQYASRMATARSKRARLHLAAELGEILSSKESAFIGYPRTDFIAAPVFGPNGGVVLTITVESPDGTLPSDRLDEIARCLIDECGVVSARISGRDPTNIV